MRLVIPAIVHRASKLALFAGILGLAAASAACGDDSGGSDPEPTGDGCTTDVECKGDRICVDRECIDPAGADDAGVGRDAGSSAGRGGSGGTAVVDDPELERACSLNCEARHAAACEMNIGSLDQCLGQCLVADEANQGYCLDEQRAQYACLASGGYTCISGYPQQRATCTAESLAVSMCAQMTPCRAFCAAAEGECAPSGEECVTECLATQAGFADAICGIYYTQLLGCWARDLTCVDGKPSVESCGPAVAEVADCIGLRNHACDGFCWAAEQLGCGSEDCVATCMTQADDTSCGNYYRSVLECTYGNRELALTCEAGVPTPSATECASAIEQYETCMTP